MIKKNSKSIKIKVPTAPYDAEDEDGSTTFSKSAYERTYQDTLAHTQSKLKLPYRIFSRVIHNKLVEACSDVIGATIARPNAILFGSMFAFFGVASLYFFARYIGFSLPGSQTIFAFLIGWAIGVSIDIISSAFRNKKH